MTNPSESAATAGTERIGRERFDPDAWVCICGNSPSSGGFYSCDQEGNETEPVIGSGWDGTYVCAECGRIIDQETLEILGRNPSPHFLF